MKRVGLYVRVSTVEQKKHGLSVDSQIDALQKFCEEHQFQIVNIYNDAGFSASKSYKTRPALQQMIADCQTNQIDLLLFTKLDRFFRSVPDYYACIERMNGIPWRSIWEDYETETSSGVFKVNIMLSIAQAESQRTSERIKAVNDFRRAKGDFVGGLAPRGYMVKKNELVVDPDMQPVIETFFKTYLSTFSPTAALDAIRDSVVINRQGALRMLKNKTYAGDSNGYKCYAYITEEEYNIIQNSLDGRRHRKPSIPDRVYIFSGLLRCEKCGCNMSSRLNRCTVRGKMYYYKAYKCNSNFTHSGCEYTATVFENSLEKYLLNELENIVNERNVYIENTVNQNRQDPDNKIRALKARLNRVGDRYEFGEISKDEYIRKRNEINEEIEKLASINKPVEYVTLPEDWKTVYSDLDDSHKRAFWNTIFKKIIVSGNGKEKKYKVEWQ